jgi:hypothetical protein
MGFLPSKLPIGGPVSDLSYPEVKAEWRMSKATNPSPPVQVGEDTLEERGEEGF